ncbi:aminotransferase class V-fold PLP-dependent enzyme [Salinimonas marina]|uniref:Aminotransferase class V-fold PLP-dependent enzyme n=1 Tax=Salinimonas marina TaxID=2785918 RepID=A0A7S9HCY6_9ALTE|nr:aminotransferase class V-fold PLP-dependent enzyme [Salinimonas marina]QPG05362.1 aminotransferase class V-fold PLP-dependent enzyme [Salinimonas marina]
MYQHFYQRYLNAHSGKQHFACHSHYFWPDVTREAMLAYWDDSARLADEKWAFFFSDVVPQTQHFISETLNTGAPEQIVFAPNTHELVSRLLSCLDFSRQVRLLTTDSEFHSASRQLQRLEETGQLQCHREPAQPFASFTDRFIGQIQQHHWDMILVSQVFFNSGWVVEHLEQIVEAVTSSDTIIVIDGYHGFMALPTDLAPIAHRVFYLAGAYKYAQAGEGACFAHVPPNNTLRPVYTGWYAEFGELASPRADAVTYAKNGMQFAGATMDFCALYRLRAVFTLFAEEGLSVERINRYIKQLQQRFLELLDAQSHPQLNRSSLLIDDENCRGHFLTFELAEAQSAKALSEQLRGKGILTDYRDRRLRFGFGLYHSLDTLAVDLS